MQQDGARPHTGKKKSGEEPVTDALNEIGATFDPPIKVITQPAQSPDLNINDLAFFRSLGVAVRKARRGTVDFDKEKLAADVVAAWNAYPQDALDAMWEYWIYCLQATVDCQGANNYSQHRSEADITAAKAKKQCLGM